MTSLLHIAAIAAALSLTGASVAAAQDNAPQHCTTLRMRRGTDSIVVQGRLTRANSAYCYRFRARAGQVLTWRLDGPATRQGISYPDGSVDAPGLPERIPLEQTGDYRFSISSNPMADGNTGHFRLRLTIR